MSDVKTTLEFVSYISDALRGARSDSLIEYSKPTRVEPIVLLDDRVASLDFTNDIMQSLTSIFAGYYLQAVALSVNVGKVDVIRLLDKVNPDRDLGDNMLRGIATMRNHFGNESLRSPFEDANSYRFALPVPGEVVGLEHFGLENTVGDVIADEVGRRYDRNRDTSTAVSGKDNLEIVREASNLSVGKLIEVEIEDGDSRAKFPIAIRLIAAATPPSGVIHTLSLGSKNTSVKERYHGWRSGQLEFIRDLVLCQDLIDDHRKGLLKDNSGIYSTTIKRRRKNRLSTIFSQNPSVATASNIVVMADETRKELERNIGGRLRDFRTREKIFKETYAMLMVVVDPQWESVTIYHRSIETPTELSAGDLKSASRGKGPDVTEILKAYTAGNTPNL